jgi:hypothetical protein
VKTVIRNNDALRIFLIAGYSRKSLPNSLPNIRDRSRSAASRCDSFTATRTAIAHRPAAIATPADRDSDRWLRPDIGADHRATRFSLDRQDLLLEQAHAVLLEDLGELRLDRVPA